MALLDLLIPRIHFSNLVLVAVGLVLVIAAIIMLYPSAASAFENASIIFRHVIAAATGLVGLYIIYNVTRTRTKIDDMIGLAAGFAMLGLATYIELGTFMESVFTSISEFFATSTPYLIAGVFALTGAVMASRSRHSTIIALILIIAALAVLGASLVHVFGW